MLAVAADAVLAVAELLAPVEEVFPGAGGLDAEFFELVRREREEGFPGGDLGGVGGEPPADSGEEAGVVGNEWCGFGSGPDGNGVLEVADVGFGERGGGCGRVEKGSEEDHCGGWGPNC